MYTLHFGVLPEAEVITSSKDVPQLVDSDAGVHLYAGHVKEQAFFSIHPVTANPVSYDRYDVLIGTDSWENWGEKATPMDASMHLSMNTRDILPADVVECIRRHLKLRLLVGRLCDWAVLTDATNWHVSAQFYMWHSNGPFPQALPGQLSVPEP